MATASLSPEEQGLRLQIARKLAGWSREQLGEKFEAAGFKKGDPAAIERQPERAKEPRRVPFTPARRELAAELLGVPVAFFTEPNHRKLFVPDEADLSSELRQAVESLEVRTHQSLAKIESRQREGGEALADVQGALLEMQKRLGIVERRTEANGRH